MLRYLVFYSVKCQLRSPLQLFFLIFVMIYTSGTQYLVQQYKVELHIL